MLRTIWAKTLRDFRIASFGWSIGLGLLVWIEFQFFASLTPAAKAQEVQLAQAYRFMGDPIAVNTAPGFVTWNIMSLLPVLLSIWAILAGSRLIRGDERNVSLDVQLTVVARRRLFLEKFAAYICVLLLVAIGIATGTLLGQASAHISVDIWRSLATGLNVSLAAFLFGVFALALSQPLRNRAAAAGIAGGCMAFFYLLDALGRAQNNGDATRRFSPFYYFEENKTLFPSPTFHPEAVALLVGISLALALLSFWIFLRRDIGEGTLRIQQPAVQNASTQAVAPERLLAKDGRDLFLRTVSLQALRRHATTIFWWAVGMGGYALFTVAVAQSSEATLQKFYANSPTLSNLFGGHDIGTNAGYIQSAVFLYLPVITVFFAMVLAIAWSSDLQQGRLEVFLSVPVSRQRLLLERFLTVFIASFIVPLVICLFILFGIAAAHFSMDTSKVVAATLGMWPLELLIVSLVFLLTSRFRTGAIVGILSLFIAVSFFVNLLNPILKLPVWILDLSFFYQYGTPLLHNVPWGPYLTILVVAALLLLLGMIQFRRSNIVAGA